MKRRGPVRARWASTPRPLRTASAPGLIQVGRPPPNGWLPVVRLAFSYSPTPPRSPVFESSWHPGPIKPNQIGSAPRVELDICQELGQFRPYRRRRASVAEQRGRCGSATTEVGAPATAGRLVDPGDLGSFRACRRGILGEGAGGRHQSGVSSIPRHQCDVRRHDAPDRSAYEDGHAVAARSDPARPCCGPRRGPDPRQDAPRPSRIRRAGRPVLPWCRAGPQPPAGRPVCGHGVERVTNGTASLRQRGRWPGGRPHR